MKTIWKFPLETTDLQTIVMPEGAEFLTLQVQAGEPALWALVDDEAPKQQRTFATYGTGRPVRDMAKRQAGEQQTYIGTYQLDAGALVWHVFEITITIDWRNIRGRIGAEDTEK